MEAYKLETKTLPLATVELFVSVVYFKAQGHADTMQSWDALLRKACPTLHLAGRARKHGRPYYDLGRRYLKRAVDLEPESSKFEAFLASAPVTGLLDNPEFFPSPQPQVESVSDESAASPSTTLISDLDPSTTPPSLEPLPCQQSDVTDQQICTGHTPPGSLLVLFGNFDESLTSTSSVRSPSIHTPAVHQTGGLDQGILQLCYSPTPSAMHDTAGMLDGIWASPESESPVTTFAHLQDIETMATPPAPPMDSTKRKRCDATMQIMPANQSFCTLMYLLKSLSTNHASQHTNSGAQK